MTTAFNTQRTQVPVLNIQSNLPALKSHTRDLLIIKGKR